MFGKIIALILALGVVGCALLAVRQARIQAFHELTQARLRIRVMDEEILKLRAEIAARVTPEHVHEMAALLGPLQPVYQRSPVREQMGGVPGLVLYDDLGRPIPGERAVLPPGLRAGEREHDTAQTGRSARNTSP